MAVELPSPGRVATGLAEDRDEVGPFTERLVVAGELGEQLVDAHDRARLVEAACRQRGAQDVERQVAHGLAEILDQHAVAEVVHVDVDPHPPLLGVDREHHPLALLRRERLEERERGVGDRLRADVRRVIERSQAGQQIRRRSSRPRTGARAGRCARRRCCTPPAAPRRHGGAPTSSAAAGCRTIATRRQPARPRYRSAC